MTHNAPITEADKKCMTLACVTSDGRMPSPPPATSMALMTAKKPNASRNTVLPSSASRACTNGDPAQVSNPAPMNVRKCDCGARSTIGLTIADHRAKMDDSFRSTKGPSLIAECQRMKSRIETPSSPPEDHRPIDALGVTDGTLVGPRI